MVATRLKYHGVKRGGPAPRRGQFLAAPLRQQTVQRAQIPMNINISCARMRTPGSRYTKSGRLSRYLVAGDDTAAGRGLVYRDEDQWEGRRLTCSCDTHHSQHCDLFVSSSASHLLRRCILFRVRLLTVGYITSDATRRLEAAEERSLRCCSV